MVSTKKEKENSIRKLLEEGHTYREITKLVHCSPNDIAQMQRSTTGEATKAKKYMKNKSHALKHFTYFKKEYL
jgi:hypothetical protein